MAKTPKPTELEKVACEVCLKEVPTSEARIREAQDYVLYYCGLECYERWAKMRPQDKARGKQS